MRRFSLPRFTLQHLALGAVCSIGAFAIGMETAGNVNPFGHSEAALDMQMGVVMHGDVNGDHVLDSKDATLLLEFAQGLETPTMEQIHMGDTDGDGALTEKDVLRVLHYLSNR